MYTHWRNAAWTHSDKVAFYKPKRELSPESNHTDTLILDFKLLQLWEKSIHPVYGIFSCQSNQINTSTMLMIFLEKIINISLLEFFSL